LKASRVESIVPLLRTGEAGQLLFLILLQVHAQRGCAMRRYLHTVHVLLHSTSLHYSGPAQHLCCTFFVVAVVVLQRCWRCGTSLHDALTRKRWTEIGRAPSYHMRFELIPTSFSRHPRILVREIPPWYFPSWQCTSFSAAFIFPELNSDDDDKQYMISHSSVYHQ
jgi:hypothetical protein